MFKALSAKFKKITSIFSKLRFNLGRKIKNLLSKSPDDSSFEELERLFFESDLGAAFSMELVDKVKAQFKKNPKMSSDEVLSEIKKEILSILGPDPQITFAEKKPHVILIVGTNGSGKTTTIAKLAKYYSGLGKKVLIAASDTFRAAAVEQIDTWASRLGVDIVKSQSGSDPSAVVFDTLTKAIKKDYDLVLIDTAGRLHTKTDLMQELEKIKRVCKKHIDDAPHETLLVLDATTGQNALDQAEIFNKFTPISSIILTKLDGTAKGGIAIALKHQKKLDVRWIGVGEGSEDLALFERESFVDSLLKH